MGAPVDAARLDALMRRLAAAARHRSRVCLTGGATAVLEGWRASTIDVDLKMVPEQDEVFRAIPRLKEELSINVELASPSDFIPELPGWDDRSRAIRTEGNLTFCHYEGSPAPRSAASRTYQVLGDCRTQSATISGPT